VSEGWGGGVKEKGREGRGGVRGEGGGGGGGRARWRREVKGRGKGRSEGCGGEEGGAELFFCTNFVLQATNALGTKLGAERKRRVGQEERKGRSREEEEGGTGREKG